MDLSQTPDKLKHDLYSYRTLNKSSTGEKKTLERAEFKVFTIYIRNCVKC